MGPGPLAGCTLYHGKYSPQGAYLQEELGETHSLGDDLEEPPNHIALHRLLRSEIFFVTFVHLALAFGNN